MVLIAETIGAVRVLTFNRPEARNALSGELVTAFYQALLDADGDGSIAVVVITGSDPAFCAGLDLKEAARDGERYFRRFETEDCINQVGHLSKPVVGAINGAAFTGGMEIALGCDFLIASERAVFADTHARVGVLPGGGMTARLPAIVGSGFARRMSMTSEVVDAATALRVGLVTEVVPHAGLRLRALAIAESIAGVPAPMLTSIKQMYVEGAGAAVRRALDVERRIASAQTLDFSGLEKRRLAVLERNRAQVHE